MNESQRAEAQALLVRAADLEGQRQAARRAHNVEHEQRLANELRRLWARYAALERVA
jgi:hypothetical protein